MPRRLVLEEVGGDVDRRLDRAVPFVPTIAVDIVDLNRRYSRLPRASTSSSLETKYRYSVGRDTPASVATSVRDNRRVPVCITSRLRGIEDAIVR